MNVRIVIGLAGIALAACRTDALPRPVVRDGTAEPGHTAVGTASDTGELATHAPVPAGQPCWDCHATDRAADHYTHDDETYAYDCGPCHPTTSWTDPATIVHDVRTPHGTSSRQQPTSPDDWLVACGPCHPTPGTFSVFVCSSCHAARDPGFFPHKTLLAPGSDADATCLGCHPGGDRIDVR